MKKFVLKTYGRFIAWILTALGLYTSCDTVEPGGIIAEYGTPTADFVVKGKVTDKSTQQPIKGMAVINKSYTSPYGNDTVRTDANGNYELKFTTTAFGAEDLTVYASDTDGEENGAYLSDTIRIKSSELKRIAKERGSWYNGKFEGKADFELKQATAIPMYGIPSAEYKEMKREEE